MKMIFHKSTVRSEVVLKTLAIKEEVRMSKFGVLGSSLDRISCKPYFSYSISRCSTGSKEEIYRCYCSVLHTFPQLFTKLVLTFVTV